MTPYVPDVASPPPLATRRGDGPPRQDAFSSSLDAAARTLRSADAAEDLFASGSGNLQDAIYERARADVVLTVATAAAQRGAQALQAIFTMQV